jgi:hypothetical protein
MVTGERAVPSTPTLSPLHTAAHTSIILNRIVCYDFSNTYFFSLFSLLLIVVVIFAILNADPSRALPVPLLIALMADVAGCTPPPLPTQAPAATSTLPAQELLALAEESVTGLFDLFHALQMKLLATSGGISEASQNDISRFAADLHSGGPGQAASASWGLTLSVQIINLLDVLFDR